MLYAVICRYRPGGAAARMPFRAEHLRYMIAARSYTVFGGPLLLDDQGDSDGMIVVIDVADRKAAEAFVAGEPYSRCGLFESVVIRRWTQMSPEPDEGFLERELAAQMAADARQGA